MIKRLLVTLTILVLLITAVIAYMLTRPLGDPQREYVIYLLPHDTPNDIFAKLLGVGMPVDRAIFSRMMIWTKADRHLKPGRYRFHGGMTHYKLAQYFRDAKPELSKITIPEGWPLRKISQALVREIPTDSLELVKLLSDTTYLRSFKIDAPSFEGYLFPQTYTFYPYIDPANVIKELVHTFETSVTPEMKSRAAELNMSLNQVITLASLIEAEAADGKERELISSVFYNRLKLGWKLQCDPTVIYALGGLDRPLLRGDLDFESPYNTYLHEGLPPGPICSPGLASIKAALYPAETKYVYFVANGAGEHIFTSSLNEHNRAITSIKRKMRVR
jgi:UPF0755 protein